MGVRWDLEFGAWDLTTSLTRRAALKAAGALIVSFAFDPREAVAQRASAAPAARTPLDVQQVDSFLAVHPDGRVTIFTSKVDVGTGMRIAIAQMAAEELGLPVSRISLVDGDTGRCPNNGGTGGSTGLTRGGTAVRQAAASARQELLRLASQRLGIPAADLTIVNGEVRAAAPVERWAGARTPRPIPIGRLHRARPFRSPRRSQGAARGAVQLHRRRHVTATARRSREVHRAVHLHPGSSSSRACSTRASCARRRSARAWCPWTRALSPLCRAFASSGWRASWRWSRRTSGPRSAPRAS